MVTAPLPGRHNGIVTDAAILPPDSEDTWREWLHEAVTMGLYVGLSLLAVLVAQPSAARAQDPNLWFTILLTAISLLLAHQVAFRLSSRLVNQGLLHASAQRALTAQGVGGLCAAAVAALPVFVLGPDGIWVSEALILAFVAVTGYRVARLVPTSRLRALLYMGVVVASVVLVLVVKGAVGH